MMIFKNAFLTKLILIVFLLIGTQDIINAQNNPRRSTGSQTKEEKEEAKESNKDTSSTGEPRFIDKLSFGGNAWAQFGQVTLVEIAPLVGYKVNDKLQVGAGPTYIYRNFTRAIDDQGNTAGYISDGNSIYGGRVFGHYNIISNFFVRTEFEALSITNYRIMTDDFDRRIVTSLLGGGGYRQMIGPRSSMNFMVLYDFNYNKYSYNLSPWVIRVGFMF